MQLRRRLEMRRVSIQRSRVPQRASESRWSTSTTSMAIYRGLLLPPCTLMVSSRMTVLLGSVAIPLLAFP